MFKSPFICMKILSHQFLCGWLLRHILSKNTQFIQCQPAITTETKYKEEKKKKEEKRQETKPEEEDIHQHVVSAQKTHHGYSYRTPSESYRKNEHETVVAEVVVALSPRHSHLAISSSPPTLKKNHKHHHFFTQLLCLSLKNTH